MPALLIVGDGDFSFTKSIVNIEQFDKHFDIISTCYESYDGVIEKYSNAANNIEFIQQKGVSILTNIDATKLSNYKFCFQFDMIIFNFPHIGGKSNIKINRNLLKNFFESVKHSRILNENGSVIVSLCQGQGGTSIDINDRIYGNSWQIEEMAAQSDFVLYDVRLFDFNRFGDYVPTGFRSQEKRFRLEGARAYVFIERVEPLSDGLLGQISLNGSIYQVASWIIDVFENRHRLEDVFAESIKMDGFSEIEWVYVVDKSIECGYKLVENNCSSDKLTIECCVLQRDSMTVKYEYLCSSPWQTVISIITSHVLQTEQLLKCVTKGHCFYTCSQNASNCKETFFISIDETKIATKGSNISLDLLSKNDRKLLSHHQIELKNIKETTLLSKMPVIEVHISKNDRIFVVNIANISRFIRDNWKINPQEKMSLKLSDESLMIIDYLFPTWFCSVTKDANDVHFDVDYMRIFQQRDELDFHIYRDLSFWWLDESCSVNVLLERLSEICRCVLRSHGDGPVTLIDDFRHADTGVRSICVRLSLKSGLVPLSRMKINALQNAVRLHCQRLFHIELR